MVNQNQAPEPNQSFWVKVSNTKWYVFMIIWLIFLGLSRLTATKPGYNEAASNIDATVNILAGLFFIVFIYSVVKAIMNRKK